MSVLGELSREEPLHAFSGSSAAGTRIDLLGILSWVRTSFPAPECLGGKKDTQCLGLEQVVFLQANNDFRLWALDGGGEEGFR